MIKKYFEKFHNLLQEKRLQYFFLFITAIIFLIWPIQGKIKFFLIIFFYISFITQSILLIRKNYIIYLFRILIIIFFCFEIIFGVLNSKNAQNQISRNENYWLQDSLLGYRIKPNCIKNRHSHPNFLRK